MINEELKQEIVDETCPLIMLGESIFDSSIVSITETGRCVYDATLMIDALVLSELLTKYEAINKILSIHHENPMDDITKPLVINTHILEEIKDRLEQERSYT